MNHNVFGIKTIRVNNTLVFTVNVKIKKNTVIYDKVKNNYFWRNYHFISEVNGKQKINFVFTTLNYNEAQIARESLLKILFTHKVINLYNSSYFTEDQKQTIICETLLELKQCTL
jgi:hypothetical protein